MLSNLSPKLKKELDEQRNISLGLEKYLKLQEQVSRLITIYWQKKTSTPTAPKFPLFKDTTGIQCGQLFKETWFIEICLC